MEAEEGNRLIAEFMGEEFMEVSLDGDTHKPLFNTSHDWLMPVLKKIREEFIESDVDLFDGMYEEQVYGIEDGVWEDNVGGLFIDACALILILNEMK